MKVLKYTDNSDYTPESDHYSLGKIDKIKNTCENRLSNDEVLAKKYGYSRGCLEECSNTFQEDCKSLIHYHSPNWNPPHPHHTNNIRDFISLIEKKLKLKQNSEVFETDNNKVTALRAAPPVRPECVSFTPVSSTSRAPCRPRNP